MLEHILFSRQRVKILRLLIQRQGWIFSESDISRELREPKATIHRHIKTLEGSNLVTSYRKGRARVYQLNKKNYIIKELLAPLFMKEYKIVIGLAESFCKKIKGADLCIVFGSASRSGMKPTSDVDIAIVSKILPDQKAIERLKSEFLEKEGVIFSVHLFKTGDFRKRYSKMDPYIIEIANGTVVLGDLDKAV